MDFKDNSKNKLNRIGEWLTVYAYNIRENAKLNDQSGAIYAENNIRDLLNFLCGLKLINGNSLSQNIKGIDLIDFDNKYCVQITLTKTKEKIQNSLNKTKTLFGDSSGWHFQIVFLSPEDDLIKKLKKNDSLKDDTLSFNPADDILDFTWIHRKIIELDTNRLEQVYDLCEKMFGNNTNNKNVFPKKIVTFNSKLLKQVFSFLERNYTTRSNLFTRFNLDPEKYSTLLNGTLPCPLEDYAPELNDELYTCLNEYIYLSDDSAEVTGRLKALKEEFSFPLDSFIWPDLLITSIVNSATNGEEICPSLPSESELSKAANIEFNEVIKTLKTLNKQSNIFITTKSNNENKQHYSIQSRFATAKKITMMVFAGTSLFAGLEIGNIYEKQESGRLWLNHQLETSALELDIILTNPSSYAGKDAALYKMKVPGVDVHDSHNIINQNIRMILDFKERYRNANITLKITDIALPFGIIYSEGSANGYNTMKTDLYPPLRDGGDGDRLSFVIRDVSEYSDIWNSLKNIINIVNTSSATKVILDKTGNVYKNFKWLINRNDPDYKTIIHRGRMNFSQKEHNVHGYWSCIRNGRPIEVDILELSDGNLIVCRDTKINLPEIYDQLVNISDLTLNELRLCHDEENQNLPFNISEIMELEEFLGMINGKVPLLIELKIDSAANEWDNYKNCEKPVKNFLEKIQYYQGPYAVHAANPWVLKVIKNNAPLIPLGQITWTFESIKNQIPEYYFNLHNNLTFINIVKPDFISQKLSEILPSPINGEASERLQRLKAFGLPIISWSDDKFSMTISTDILTSVENDICNHVLECREDI